MNIPITSQVLDACPAVSTAITTSSNVSCFLISVVDTATNTDVTSSGIVTLNSLTFTIQIASNKYCSTYLITFLVGLSQETLVEEPYGS